MKRTTWTLILAGLLAGGLGLNLTVTQPLHRQIETLSTEVDELQSGMRLVADYRDDVAGTNDLLSGLEQQGQRINHARAAIEEMRRLEREVQLQSASANEALAAMSAISRVQSEVIAQGERAADMQATLQQIASCQKQAAHLADVAQQELTNIDRAEDSLRQLGDFHQRVAIESSGIEVAANRFSQLRDLKQSMEQVQPATIDAARQKLADFDALARDVIDDGQQTEQARKVTGQLIALQNDLVVHGTRATAARQHAEQLLEIEKILAHDAGSNIDAATENLAAMLKLEEQLAAQDQHLAAAVESLELLEDLQSEFFARTRNLENIRQGLTELIMMESMVARTVRTLQPLSELASLRRLDSDRLRSIARSMMESDRPRVATNEISLADEELVPVPPAE